MPLKNINYNVTIENNMAQVELSQYYENSLDKTIEINYYFPISPDATIVSFKA